MITPTRNTLKLAGLACAALALMAGAALAQDKILVATEASFPPFSKTEADGTYTGLEIELGNAVCERIGVECEWVKQDFDGMIAALIAGKFDMVFSSMSIKPEREKVADFSIPYYSDSSMFYGPSGMSVDALDGKIVGTYAGSSQDHFLQEKFADRITIRGYENIDLINADLDAGRIDVAFVESMPAAEFLASDAGKAYAAFGPSYTDPILGKGAGAMFPKGDPLKEKVDAAIREIYADGTFDEICAKYLPEGASIRAEDLW